MVDWEAQMREQAEIAACSIVLLDCQCEFLSDEELAGGSGRIDRASDRVAGGVDGGLQKRILDAKNKPMIPVFNYDGKVAKHIYPFTPNQLAQDWNGRRIYHPDDAPCPKSRAIVELIHNDRLAAA